jgi:hypothetical protein
MYLNDTRVEILKQLMGWAEGSGKDKSVFWLTGLPGIGKSFITRALCERLADAGLLGASFFISRIAAERCDPSNIVRTLVHHLAHTQPYLRPHICAALRDNPLVADEALSTQLKTLLAEPYARASQLDRPVVVVIDGLDECEKDKDTGREGGQLLPLLVETFEACQPWLKLLIASRHEPTIRDMFAPFQPVTFQLRQVDIYRYLEHSLGEISKEHKSILPPGWPTKDVIDELVRRSDTNFVYASTVVKILQHSRLLPDEVLEIILSPEFRSGMNARLDELYIYVLHMAVDIGTPELSVLVLTRLKKLLGVLLVPQSPVSVEELAVLLEVDQLSMRRDLESLSAIVILPHDDSERSVRLIHSSFADFLQDPHRCTEIFHVDSQISLRERVNITSPMLSLGPQYYDLYLKIRHAGRRSSGLQQRRELTTCSPGI